MNLFLPVFILFVFAVAVHAVSEVERIRVIMECGKAHGLERLMKKEIEEATKNGKSPRLPDLQSQEVLCSLKCQFERLGVLSNGKFDLEKVKETNLINEIKADKIDVYLKCLKDIEITKCSDLMKCHECKKAAVQ